MIRFELLAEKHDRVGFSCGVDSLDRFLRENAAQSARKRLSVTVVAVGPQRPIAILGYYAVSSIEILGTALPETLRRRLRLPTHSVSAVLLGRLAVSTHHHRRGVGARLLGDALQRALKASRTIGSTVVVVDAIGDGATAFYAHYGFVPSGNPGRLFLPIGTIAQLDDSHT